MTAYVFSKPDSPEDLICRHVRETCKIIGPAKYSEEIEACFSLMYRLVHELRSRIAQAEAIMESSGHPTTGQQEK
jgi:hypothetical protein